MDELNRGLQELLQQLRAGEITAEEHQLEKEILLDEHAPRFEARKPEVAESPQGFDSFAVKRLPSLPALPGLVYDPALGKYVPTDVVIAKVKSAGMTTPRTQVGADPCRKNGRFISEAAQLWYLNDKGDFTRKSAKGPNAIGNTFADQARVQREWDADEHLAFVKYRDGDMKGNRHVHLVGPDHYLVSPQQEVELCIAAGQDLGRNRHGPGEKHTKSSQKAIRLMLEANKEYKSTDENPKADRTWTEYPCVELATGKEVMYHLRFNGCVQGSVWPDDVPGPPNTPEGIDGAVRTVTEVPMADEKDEHGNVLIPGHRKLAIKLLAEAIGDRTSCIVVSWEADGQQHTITHDEVWALLGEKKEDETLRKLAEADEADDEIPQENRIPVDEYMLSQDGAQEYMSYRHRAEIKAQAPYEPPGEATTRDRTRSGSSKSWKEINKGKAKNSKQGATYGRMKTAQDRVFRLVG
jgi:hypothetical protein